MAKKGWVMLKNLRPGAVFQTSDGKKYFKADPSHTHNLYFSLLDGTHMSFGGTLYVSEVSVNPLGYYFLGAMFGSMQTRQLSDEDKAKLDKLIKKFLDGTTL